jgi:hypothetical protein
VLRRVAPNDLPFFTRLHALPEVAQHLYPGGRPRSPGETAAWFRYTLASYDQLALGYLAVLRKEDGALIGRCGLMDLVVESAAPEHGLRRGWFGREEAPAGDRYVWPLAPGGAAHLQAASTKSGGIHEIGVARTRRRSLTRSPGPHAAALSEGSSGRGPWRS